MKTFKNGDRVLANDGFLREAREGTIVTITEHHDLSYGVDFGLPVDNEGRTHNLGGKLEESTGRWFMSKDLVPLLHREWDDEKNKEK